MLRQFICALALVCAILIAAGNSCGAAGVYTVKLQASRYVLLADGKHTTDITATVRDPSGRQLTSAVPVSFTTTTGQLSQMQAYTDFTGMARVHLTSAPNPGIAHITANVSGGVPDAIDIEFTDDPAATYMGNNYMQFTAKNYLAYSTTDHIVICSGKDGTSRATYRNFEVSADDIQYRCDDAIMRAHGNVTLKRAKHEVKLTSLYYNLISGEGYALTQEKDGTSKSVKIIGEQLREDPLPGPPPFSYMQMPKTEVKLVIVAVSITYFPNDKLQFRRPKFFQNGVQVMTLPYYEIPLHSDQLFTDQFISVGTSGLGVVLPLYYQLSPSKYGEVVLWRQQQIGRGYYATEPGWGIDLTQGYSSNGDRRYEGSYGFTGLTRADWDFRWNHNQEFGSNTQTSFDLEFPQHEAVYGDTNITQQLGKFRWGANMSAGSTFLGDHTLSTDGNFYLETQPKMLPGSKNMLYTVGTTFLSEHSSSLDPTIPTASETREGVNFHTFSRPIQIDAHTTFNDSITVGNTWAGHEGSGFTSLATLAVDHTINKGGSVNLTYDLVLQPETFIDTSGKHRISASYTYSKNKKMTLTVFGSTYLDAQDSSMLADLAYRLDSRWRIMADATVERLNALSYTDFELTVGRRIGGRELQLTYSTYLHRVSLDFTATRF